MSVHWSEVPAGDLDVRRLHDLLELRCRIFVVEQECAYQDVDGLDLDDSTWHVLAHADDTLVAYARILRDTPATSHSGATAGLRIGRVIVDSSRRGTGLGRELLRRCVDLCHREGAGAEVVLSAQAHLVDFYAGFGFAAIGEPYDEDGIPHVDMRLTA